jgi:hypothetical protein
MLQDAAHRLGGLGEACQFDVAINSDTECEKALFQDAFCFGLGNRKCEGIGRMNAIEIDTRQVLAVGNEIRGMQPQAG